MAMELDEMKTIWTELSSEVEKQKVLTDKLIMDMTQERYHSKISKIATYETTGALVCFAMALFILFNISQLDTWYLLLCGIFSVAYLILMPASVLYTINQMKRIDIGGKNFRQVVADFGGWKKRFLTIQKWAIFINFLFMLVVLPLAGKLLSGKDLFQDSRVWVWYIPFMSLFLLVFSRWGYRHYKKLVAQARGILAELDE